MPNKPTPNDPAKQQKDQALASTLADYLLNDITPEVSPALWQDVEILIRYLKRDVWALDDDQRANAQRALNLYRAKYVIERLPKEIIEQLLKEFFESEGERSLLDALAKKFYAPVDDLLMVQEQRTVTKDDLTSLDVFDKLFAYPAWLDFSDDANDYIFDQILHNKLSDTQIDYFLGAADTMKDYEKWFKVAQHVLNTTQDPHTFWIAGDILAIVWKAVPKDQKSQKWFKDEIFQIFWPRVGSVWPILNQDKISFDTDESSKILADAIGWLEELDDLKDRLPELGADYVPKERTSDREEFARAEGFLLGRIDSENATLSELMNLFFELSELVYDEANLKQYERLARENLTPALERFRDEADLPKARDWVERSLAHAKDYVETLQRERKRLAEYLIAA